MHSSFYVMWFSLHFWLFQITLCSQMYSPDSSLCHTRSLGLCFKREFMLLDQKQGFQNRNFSSLDHLKMVFCNQWEVDLWHERLNNLYLSFITSTTLSCPPSLLLSLWSSWLLLIIAHMQYYGGNVTHEAVDLANWIHNCSGFTPTATPQPFKRQKN